MRNGARVAVVVPAYNEERLVARTLRTIPAYVDRVVVVDDASTDQTAREIASVADARIEQVRHAANRGVGAAIVTGYRRAFAAGAHVAAVMAGDGQMDPRDLDALLAPILAGDADYAKGDRLSHRDVLARMPLARWIGSQGLSVMTRLTTGLDVHDSQCGYTALRREAFARLDALDHMDALWPGNGYPNDLLSRMAVAGLRVTDVVVRPVYGDEESGIRARHLVTAFPRVLAASLARRIRASRSDQLRPRAAIGHGAPQGRSEPILRASP
jgi:glycosyltransferase involved in cell wall biosynthesis